MNGRMKGHMGLTFIKKKKKKNHKSEVQSSLRSNCKLRNMFVETQPYISGLDNLMHVVLAFLSIHIVP